MLNGKQLLLNEHKLNELMTTKSKVEEANYKKKKTFEDSPLFTASPAKMLDFLRELRLCWIFHIFGLGEKQGSYELV